MRDGCFRRGCRRRGRFGGGFLCRGVGVEIGDNRAVLERPDRLGDELEHLGVLGGIVSAVRVVLAHLHLGRALHLHGIGVRRHLGHGVGRRGGGHGAITVIDIRPLGFGREHQAKAGIVPDHTALPGLHAVGIRQQLIMTRAVERQREVQEQAGVSVQQALGGRGDELIVLHHVRIAAVAVEAHGEGTAQGGPAVAHDRAVCEHPGRLGHEVQHGGVVVRVVHAVLGAAADVHAHGLLHLGGVGVHAHLKDRVARNARGDHAVAAGGVAALGVHGDDLA